MTPEPAISHPTVNPHTMAAAKAQRTSVIIMWAAITAIIATDIAAVALTVGALLLLTR